MAIQTLPSVEVLNKWFRYDPETGILHWTTWHKNAKAKMALKAGCEVNGYIIVGLLRRTYPAHRIIWKMMTGRDPVGFLDHINRNGLDNRWCNLREATPFQNICNAYRPNKSGYKGVKWCHASFQASIRAHGRQIYLGSFKTAEEAHEAYKRAARELHGEYARVAP